MSKDKRDSFIFYRSFYEAMEDLPDAEQLIIYKSITVYALEGVEPNITGYPKAIFRLIKPILEANNKRWENGKKGASHGIKGGRPKKDNETPKQPQENPTSTPNKDVDVDKDINIVESSDSTSELSFEKIWELYGKKGNKKTSEQRWSNLSTSKKRLALINIPLYVQSTPDKQYRKDFQAYINQEVWNDELIINDGKTPTGKLVLKM